MSEQAHTHKWIDDEEFSFGNEQGQTCECGLVRRVHSEKRALEAAFWAGANYARSRDGLAWEPEIILEEVLKESGV